MTDLYRDKLCPDKAPDPPLFTIGTEVPGYGKVAALGCRDGERWYMFTNGNGVSLLPGPVVERLMNGEDVRQKFTATVTDKTMEEWINDGK